MGKSLLIPTILSVNNWDAVPATSGWEFGLTLGNDKGAT